jgi:hypothetical protein
MPFDITKIKFIEKEISELEAKIKKDIKLTENEQNNAEMFFIKFLEIMNEAELSQFNLERFNKMITLFNIEYHIDDLLRYAGIFLYIIKDKYPPQE